MRNSLMFFPLGVSLMACGMGLLFAMSAKSSPPGSGVIPAALAFMAVSLLGTSWSIVIGVQNRRIQELEQRLKEVEAQDSADARTLVWNYE